MRRALALSILTLFAVSLVLSIARRAQASGPTFTTIDFPGAASFTLAGDINKTGQIVGRYIDSSGINHGFLLSGGMFTSVTFPGAVWTRALGINNNGDSVGDYSLTDARGDNVHGYLLHAGKFFPFDFPGAATTVVVGIDTNGDMVGFYTLNLGNNTSITGEGGNNIHGFLLSKGVFTSIDFPGALSTQAWRINDHGEIAGRYLSTSDDKWHIYYRLGGGGFIPVTDFPGAVQSSPPGYAEVGGLNSQGDIASSYCGSSPCQHISNANVVANVHGFLLSNGVYTSIDFPAALGTISFGVNDSDDVVGAYEDPSGAIHGYLRTP